MGRKCKSTLLHGGPNVFDGCYGGGGKRQDNWRSHDWRLHRDIAPGHTALSVQPSLTLSNMALGNTYSLDSTPCDVSVFPKTIIPCKGQRFKDVPEIAAEILVVLGKRDF